MAHEAAGTTCSIIVLRTWALPESSLNDCDPRCSAVDQPTVLAADLGRVVGALDKQLQQDRRVFGELVQAACGRAWYSDRDVGVGRSAARYPGRYDYFRIKCGNGPLGCLRGEH